jgi:hypothetical protein
MVISRRAISVSASGFPANAGSWYHKSSAGGGWAAAAISQQA